MSGTNIDIGGGTANYALFNAGKISGTAVSTSAGRLPGDRQPGRVVYADKPADDCG
ncbi:ethanolamine ammonia-lyase reactivating factor EutA [Escherichia coli]